MNRFSSLVCIVGTEGRLSRREEEGREGGRERGRREGGREGKKEGGEGGVDLL